MRNESDMQTWLSATESGSRAENNNPPEDRVQMAQGAVIIRRQCSHRDNWPVCRDIGNHGRKVGRLTHEIVQSDFATSSATYLCLWKYLQKLHFFTNLEHFHLER